MKLVLDKSQWNYLKKDLREGIAHSEMVVRHAKGTEWEKEVKITEIEANNSIERKLLTKLTEAKAGDRDCFYVSLTKAEKSNLEFTLCMSVQQSAAMTDAISKKKERSAHYRWGKKTKMLCGMLSQFGYDTDKYIAKKKAEWQAGGGWTEAKD